MNFEIRKPFFSEADTIWEIEKACFPPKEAASLSAIEHRIRAFTNTFFVLEEIQNQSRKIVGFINGCRSQKDRIEDAMFLPTCHNDEKGDYVLIFSLAVAPDYQGKVYGRKLMQHLMEVSAQNGVKEMVLTCKEKYLPYYASMAYENCGISESTHGGAVWYDMIAKL